MIYDYLVRYTSALTALSQYDMAREVDKQTPPSATSITSLAQKFGSSTKTRNSNSGVFKLLTISSIR